MNEPNYTARELTSSVDRELTQVIESENDLRNLAEQIVRYCPSLTHLLLAMGSEERENPLQGLN